MKSWGNGVGSKKQSKKKKKSGGRMEARTVFLNNVNTANDHYNKCLFEIQLLYLA